MRLPAGRVEVARRGVAVFHKKPAFQRERKVCVWLRLLVYQVCWFAPILFDTTP